MSISKNPDWRRKRERYDDARDTARRTCEARIANLATHRRRSRRPSRSRRRRRRHRPRPSSPRRRRRLHAGRIAIPSRRGAAAPPPPVQAGFDSMPPPPPAAKPVEAPRRVAGRARFASGRGRAVGFSDRRLADRRQRNGADRQMRQCAVRLCARIQSNEKGEAILINMKPKTERQWTGSVYSQDSRRDVLRHDVDQGDQHASRRSLRARPLLLLRQQLEPHHTPRRQPGDVVADARPGPGRSAHENAR